MFEIRCVSIHDRLQLQTTEGPANVAADALHVCRKASGFGSADHVMIITINYLYTNVPVNR